MSHNHTSTSSSMLDGMRRLVSGVCVITANNGDGERSAMTASSVTSVSAEPPSLLVCVNRQARLDQAMIESGAFCVNVLGPKHEQISTICATPEKGCTRFELGDWALDEETGLSFLADAQAVFFCRKQATHAYGTHNIFIGDVLRTRVTEGEVKSLAYLNGSYRML
ncbi:flavin reductase family protein [Teredinibacter haidensis]|uniref:flavin reductase family protein n=1 Tax=Teredinibacter haidensis TaxID=2731755 RepID=UPI000948EB6D|nr:flavin reductase family protein [Teredinibacter haidensis]